MQRFLFGWMPFSIGDLFYGFLIVVILYKTFSFFQAAFSKKTEPKIFCSSIATSHFLFSVFYVFFNLLWGLNYNRQGIAYQLGLEVKEYSLADLDTLTNVIQNRVNYYAGFVTEAQRDSFDRKARLFNSAVDAYKDAAKKYPFLTYHQNQ